MLTWSWHYLMLFHVANPWVSLRVHIKIREKLNEYKKGIHKHFRIISVQKQFNQHSPVNCSIQEIWQRLGEFYGMSALDELEEEDEEEEEKRMEKRREGNEFSLPLDEYEQLISEHRQEDDTEEEEDESNVPTKRTRTSKRDGSPSSVAAESITSTPEPEESKKKKKKIHPCSPTTN